MVKRCLLVLALVATQSVPAPCAAAAPTSQNLRSPSREFLEWKNRAIAVLAARADAPSLATAAALHFAGSQVKPETLPPDLSAFDLAMRAGELAPQNAAIGWLRLRICSETPACDIRAIATITRWVDADNAAVWLPTLSVAQRARDVMETDRILSDMARASHFDLYWLLTLRAANWRGMHGLPTRCASPTSALSRQPQLFRHLRLWRMHVGNRPLRPSGANPA